MGEFPLWRQALTGVAMGRPLIQPGVVMVITDGGLLSAYSAQGDPLWTFNARGRVSPFISRSREGMTYLARNTGQLIAVARTGREIWRVNLGSPLVSPVLTGWDGRIFAFTQGRITCLSPSGNTLWTRRIEGETLIGPIRDNGGGIIMVQEEGNIIRVDPFGTVSLWNTGDSPSAIASLQLGTLGHSILLFYEEERRIELLYPSHNGLEVLYPPPKEEDSEDDTPEDTLEEAPEEPEIHPLELPSHVIAAQGRGPEAVLVLADGSMALISLRTRTIPWIGQSHLRPGEMPARAQEIELQYDDRGIYAFTRFGATGYNTQGMLLWFMRLRGASGLPSLGAEGILFSGGQDWVLYAYHMEDRVVANQHLIYGGDIEGSYGLGNLPSGFPFQFEDREILNRFQEIRRAIRTGTVGGNERFYINFLMEISGSVTLQRFTTWGVHYREEATRLLGFIGTREIVPYLTDLFLRDPEPVIKAAAASALGMVGLDPNGIVLRAFENALYPPQSIRDEAVLTAIALSTGSLCRYGGPPLADAAVRILARLARDDMPGRTQLQARLELNNLM